MPKQFNPPAKTVFLPFIYFCPQIHQFLQNSIQSMKALVPIIITLFSLSQDVSALQILSKSKIQKCEKVSDSKDPLNCTSKIILDLAVPSESVSVCMYVVRISRFKDHHLWVFFLAFVRCCRRVGGRRRWWRR